jgi:hypothetical protein
MVTLLVRLNRQYESEAEELEHDAPTAAEAPILRRHVVIVFIEKLDLSAARAIQYARALGPDELQAVHFALDPVEAEDLQAAWTRLGFSRLSLQVLDVPDRRLTRAALEVVAEALADGDTEVSVLLPRLEHNRFWHKLLHDRTADNIAEALSQLPHANVTFVPFHLQAKARNQVRVRRTPHVPRRSASNGSARPDHVPPFVAPDGCTPLDQVQFRQRLRVAGRVRSLRVQPWSGVASLEAELVDATGGRLAVVFMGRRQVAGIDVGAHLVVEGMVGEHGGRLAMLNPDYEIVPDEHERPPTSH